MRRALVRLSPELVRERLQLPDNSDVIGATWDTACHCLLLSVISPEFPDMQRDHHAPIVTYSVTSKWNL